MDTEKIKAVIRCLDDDLNEQHGAGAIDAACAAVDALEADANRYCAVKAMVCETDKAAQGRMLAAMEQFEPACDMFNEDSCTPEQFDAFADTFVAAIQGARDANR